MRPSVCCQPAFRLPMTTELPAIWKDRKRTAEFVRAMLATNPKPVEPPKVRLDGVKFLAINPEQDGGTIRAYQLRGRILVQTKVAAPGVQAKWFDLGPASALMKPLPPSNVTFAPERKG